jgi:hypothetical protein
MTDTMTSHNIDATSWGTLYNARYCHRKLQKETNFGVSEDDTTVFVWLNLIKAEYHIGYEVLTAVTVVAVFFWDVTPCSPVELYVRIEEMSCVHLQDCRVTVWFGSLFKSEIGDSYVPTKRLYKLFTTLHGIASQKKSLSFCISCT